MMAIEAAILMEEEPTPSSMQEEEPAAIAAQRREEERIARDVARAQVQATTQPQPASRERPSSQPRPARLAPLNNNLPSMLPVAVVAERARQVHRYNVDIARGMERNRQAVAAYAGGGGGTAAHMADQTTRGHLWLLPRDSPLRRPWRANVVARPTTSTSDANGPLKLSVPLSEEQLDQLRRTCAVTSPEALPEDVECAICYTPLELAFASLLARDSCIVCLPCGGGHVFHYRCVEPWLRKGRLCPSCRQTLKLSKKVSREARRPSTSTSIPPRTAHAAAAGISPRLSVIRERQRRAPPWH